jgi:hypothetical protein
MRKRHSQHGSHESRILAKAALSRYLPDRPLTGLHGPAPRRRLERPLLPATRVALSDVFAQRNVDGRFSASIRTDFVLGAFEQAMYARQPDLGSSLVHQCDCGAQYASTATPSVWLRRGSSLQWAARATQLRQLSRRAEIGLLVQQPSMAGTHRLHPSRLGRGKLAKATRH